MSKKTSLKDLKKSGQQRRKNGTAPADDFVPSTQAEIDEALPVAAHSEPLNPIEPPDEVPIDDPGHQSTGDEILDEKLGFLNISPGARKRVDVATDSLIRQDGSALMAYDKDAAAVAKMRAELIVAANSDLVEAATILHEGLPFTESVKEIVALCRAVMKGVVYGASLDMERLVRGHVANGEQIPVHDVRDHLRQPPYGLAPEHSDDYWPESTIEEEVSDANLFLNVLARSFGYDGDDIPLATEMLVDGTYLPLTNARQAIERQMVKNAARRSRQAQRREANVLAALAKRKAILAAAGKSKQ